MQLITPVNIPISTRTIGYKDKILLLGSCFADNVGKKFQEYYFQTTVNPLGTLYNPASIAQAIQLANSELSVETLPLVLWYGGVLGWIERFRDPFDIGQRIPCLGGSCHKR